jgi:hypothetical protein
MATDDDLADVDVDDDRCLNQALSKTTVYGGFRFW